MKFSLLLPTLLASLAFSVGASPIANPAAVDIAPSIAGQEAVPAPIDLDLEKRADPKKSAFYQDAEKAAGKLEVGKSYVFEMRWNRGRLGDEGDAELKALRDRLTYDHVAILVGQVVQKESGPPKKRVISELDFVGEFVHLVTVSGKESGKKTEQVKIDAPSVAKGLQSYQKLKFAKQASVRPAAGASPFRATLTKISNDYLAQPNKKVYSTVNNNCATFKDYAVGKL